jgi:hypothetical protein
MIVRLKWLTVVFLGVAICMAGVAPLSARELDVEMSPEFEGDPGGGFVGVPASWLYSDDRDSSSGELSSGLWNLSSLSLIGIVNPPSGISHIANHRAFEQRVPTTFGCSKRIIAVDRRGGH